MGFVSSLKNFFRGKKKSKKVSMNALRRFAEKNNLRVPGNMDSASQILNSARDSIPIARARMEAAEKVAQEAKKSGNREAQNLMHEEFGKIMQDLLGEMGKKGNAEVAAVTKLADNAAPTLSKGVPVQSAPKGSVKRTPGSIEARVRALALDKDTPPVLAKMLLEYLERTPRRVQASEDRKLAAKMQGSEDRKHRRVLSAASRARRRTLSAQSRAKRRALSAESRARRRSVRRSVRRDASPLVAKVNAELKIEELKEAAAVLRLSAQKSLQSAERRDALRRAASAEKKAASLRRRQVSEDRKVAVRLQESQERAAAKLAELKVADDKLAVATRAEEAAREAARKAESAEKKAETRRKESEARVEAKANEIRATSNARRAAEAAEAEQKKADELKLEEEKARRAVEIAQRDAEEGRKIREVAEEKARKAAFDAKVKQDEADRLQEQGAKIVALEKERRRLETLKKTPDHFGAKTKRNLNYYARAVGDGARYVNPLRFIPGWRQTPTSGFSEPMQKIVIKLNFINLNDESDNKRTRLEVNSSNQVRDVIDAALEKFPHLPTVNGVTLSLDGKVLQPHHELYKHGVEDNTLVVVTYPELQKAYED